MKPIEEQIREEYTYLNKWEEEFDNKFHWKMDKEMKQCLCEDIKRFIRKLKKSEQLKLIEKIKLEEKPLVWGMDIISQTDRVLNNYVNIGWELARKELNAKLDKLKGEINGE